MTEAGLRHSLAMECGVLFFEDKCVGPFVPSVEQVLISSNARSSSNATEPAVTCGAAFGSGAWMGSSSRVGRVSRAGL